MLKQAGIALSLIALLSISSMAKNNGQTQSTNGQVQTQPSTQTTVDTSSSEFSSGLIFMAEEEKVARDVYLYLSEYWGSRIFSNIASSEQTHMDTVEELLNTYSLPVPSTMDSRGVFENSELQELYDSLIAKGQQSLVDALEVGVLIEETDIIDLNELLEENPPSDVATAYNNLLDGSYSHLDSFNKQLSNN